ncbi:MAG: MMPL family transporter [Pararhodobacter sp.]|nr:MMPL family transporter [Pararhodobacter sp.]
MRRLIALPFTRPGLVLALAALMAGMMLASAAMRLGFDGDLVRILSSPSPAFQRFEALEDDFHPFSADETLLLETDDFGLPERFDALDDILAEFHFLPDVAAVWSIFPLAANTPDRARQSSAAWLDALHAQDPAARMMLSADRGAMLVLLMPESAAGLSQEARDEALAAVAAIGGGEIGASFIGLAASYRALEGALIAAQLSLAPIAVFLCLGMGWALLRSWRAALVIALPGLAAAAWLLGALALMGIPFDVIITLVPLLVLVLGVAQAMHLAFAIRQAGENGLAPRAACEKARAEVGPACVLSTLTTMIAFASFALAGFDALDRLALAGLVGLALQLVAVLALTPALALVVGAAGSLPSQRHSGARFGPLPASPRWLDAPARAGLRLLPWRRAVMLAGIAALAVALTGHLRIAPGHSLDEHLLRGGEVARAEDRIRDRLPGTGQVFVTVQAVEPGPLLSEAEQSRLLMALETVAPEDQSHEQTVARLADALARAADSGGADPPLLRRVMAGDGSARAIPLIAPLAPDAAVAAAEASAREARLVAAGIDGMAALTGLSHLAAIEVPRMVEALRRGLLMTIVMIVALIGMITRSLWLALAALVANAVPVLGVEAVLWMAGQPLTMTAAVALTIAFGIAVDDTLHLLNRWRIERAHAPRHALVRAVRAVARPIVGSTALILAGLAATQISALPSVATFGLIVMLSMLAALVATLMVLPAFLPADARAGKDGKS